MPDLPYLGDPRTRPPGPPNGKIGSFNTSGQDPNTGFNPGPGQDSKNALNFSSGGDTGPDSTLVSASPNGGATAPQNTEYQQWTWEQILNMLLGLELPDRSYITNGRWTGIEDNSATDPGLFRIFQIKWHEGTGNLKTANVYLSPEFTAESTSTSPPSQSPWLVFEQGPGQVLGTKSGGASWTSGAYGLDVPGNSELQLDPSQFAPAVQALMDAENFYLNAMDNLGFVTENLSGNANQFQGAAGGEFAQLMQDFSQQAIYAQGKMGLSVDQHSSYSGLVLQAGNAASSFLLGIWNAWAGWTQLLTHTPLGAILQALIDVGVIITGTAGNWSVANVNLENIVPQGVGDLRGDPAWQKIENLAKTIWQAEVVNALDVGGRAALTGLEQGYYNAANKLIPLKAPAPAQIGSGVGSPNGGDFSLLPNNFSLFPNNFSLFPNNFSLFPNDFSLFPKDFSLIPNNFSLFPNNFSLFPNNFSLFPNGLYGSSPNNTYGLLSGGPNGGTASPNIDFSGLIPNGLFDHVFPNGLFSGLIPNGSYGTSSPNYTYDAMSTGLSPNQPSGVVYSPNQPSGVVYSPNQPSGVVYSPNQLESGIGSQTPSAVVASPTQTPVTGTLGSGTSGTNSQNALQQALDSNAGTQDALQAALTSGQVPPGSALQQDLNTALNDANQTQAALNQAAGAGNATGSALQSALADNAGTQAAVNQALNSGQVTSGSPLASTLQSAQTSANQTQAALNQAVAAGPAPSAAQTTATQTALGDNSQTQQALNQALQSGQVPANSPLHSTIQSAVTDAGKTQAAITQALKSGTGATTTSLDQALKDNQATQNALNQALASGQVPATGPLRNDLNQALADSKQTGTALQQALAQQGVLTEPNVSALTSPVGVSGVASAGTGLGSTPLVSATLPAHTTAQAGPVSSGAFAPATQTATQTAAAGESPFPMYSPMAGGGMMGGQGMGQGQGQERERSTWLAEDEDVWGTDPDVGPQVLGRDYTGDEEPEEYDGYTGRPERPTPRRPTRREPGR